MFSETLLKRAVALGLLEFCKSHTHGFYTWPELCPDICEKRFLGFNETSFSQLSCSADSSQTYGTKAALPDSSVSGEAIHRDCQKNISID